MTSQGQGSGSTTPQPKPGVAVPGTPHTPSVQALMSMQQKQNRIAPVPKPSGLDPVELLNERENRFVEDPYFNSFIKYIIYK